MPRRLTAGDQETVSEPGLEEPVLVGFVDVHVTREDHFHVARVCQEDQQFRSKPYPDDVIVVVRFVEDVLEDRCNRRIDNYFLIRYHII